MGLLKRLTIPVLALVLTIFIISKGEFTYENIATELLGAILFTLIFFLIRNTFAPVLKISPYIALQSNDDKKKIPVLKFVNYSFSSVNDVHISARIIRRVANSQGRFEMYIENLKLELEYIRSIDGMWGSFRNRVNSNTIRVALPTEILNKVDENESTLELMISCRDSVAGREKTFVHKYHHLKSEIVDGYFQTGRSLEID